MSKPGKPRPFNAEDLLVLTRFFGFGNSVPEFLAFVSQQQINQEVREARQKRVGKRQA